MLHRLSLALVATLAPLSAQQVPPKVDLASELDEIVNTDQIQAASKKVQDVASAPADVVVLRGAELKALGYRTLGDALGGVLGFVTNSDHAYQGIGMAGAYTLGDQNTRLLVLLDGHALNSPAEVGSSKVGEDFGLPLELVDHIEIVRGPASSLYGNNAFQALVNVSSVFAAGSTASPFQGAATGGTDHLGELWAQGTFALPGATASLMLSGFRRTGTALDFPQLQPQPLPADADGENRQSAYLYVKGREWSFAGSVLTRTQGLASGPYQSVPGDPDNYYVNRRLSAELKWEPRTDSVRWLFRLFGDQNTFQDSFIQFENGSNDHEQDHDPDQSLGVEAQGRATLSDQVSLTFGTELQYHRYDGIYSDDQGNSVATEVSYGIGNTYLEGSWQPSAAWNMVVGLQEADWIPDQIRNAVDGTWQDLQKQSISRLTPRFSLIFRPQAGEVVKMIFGQGFRFPTIFERYYTDNETQAANTAIDPEVVSSGQLCWSRKWTPALTSLVTGSVFTIQHAIQPGTVQVAGNAEEQYQNAPDSKLGKAVETELAWRHAGTELSAGAGYYDWTYQGAALANSSRWTGVAKAIQRLGSLTLAGEARYIDGRQDTSQASGAPVVTTVPANWTLRASARYEGARWWAQASVEDLANSRRRDLVGPEYYPVTWMEADGRTLRVTVGFRR